MKTEKIVTRDMTRHWGPPIKVPPIMVLFVVIEVTFWFCDRPSGGFASRRIYHSLGPFVGVSMSHADFKKCQCPMSIYL